MTTPQRSPGGHQSLHGSYDPKTDEYLVPLLATVDTLSRLHPVPLDARVPLWYDWVVDATFEVQVQK